MKKITLADIPAPLVHEIEQRALLERQRRAGRVTSDKKAAAARANGAKHKAYKNNSK